MAQPISFAAKIIIQDCKQKSDGQSPLYLELVSERKKKLIWLKLNWPAAFFDKQAQMIRATTL